MTLVKFEALLRELATVLNACCDKIQRYRWHNHVQVNFTSLLNCEAQLPDYLVIDIFLRNHKLADQMAFTSFIFANTLLNDLCKFLWLHTKSWTQVCLQTAPTVVLIDELLELNVELLLGDVVVRDASGTLLTTRQHMNVLSKQISLD